MKTKGSSILLLCLILAVLLCACVVQSDRYTVVRNGVEFQVDTLEYTISDGTYTYLYSFTGDSKSYHISISYPNGASYSCTKRNSFETMGYSDNYDEDTYADGDTLCDIVAVNIPTKADSSAVAKLLVALVIIALGALEIKFPHISWYLGYGWRFKDAEPSEAALFFGRIGGVVMILLGILLLLSAF